MSRFHAGLFACSGCDIHRSRTDDDRGRGGSGLIRMLRRVGVLWKNFRSLVYSVVLCCDRILWESVLDLIRLEREFAYEPPIDFSRSFNRELRIRGSDLTTWELGVTRALQIHGSISEVFSMSATSE
jgi:hypothetical protein